MSVHTALETLGVRGWAAENRTAVWEYLFPNTAGPFMGVATEQAFTSFDLAAYRIGRIDLCVAGSRTYGAAVDGAAAEDHGAYTTVTGRCIKAR
ncbi:hypothetical protein SA2016_1005 [Sinomonas atrocyanea]|uniref:Uncharacterized protein n=1 Tax=Sinomonas atrocyanea TaxID=37927 RepID=A0A126ZWY7_9MICC|nr:hypothetical protein [Sinomonas atrocyanea]AMM31690.1 hypothetical protein SA2016_1005 [Sinomonas atrocyanea]GEB65320.1 hypothetical protein SAT01_27680 [Sinomonas atrocyanea]GGG59264.1 hypothetical protein GCM10007172_07670 [Sinomonas atrocyanea]